jgi:hypothetical protein
MGSGSTIAAADAVGYQSVGIEIDKDYFRLAGAATLKLAALYPTFEGSRLEFDSIDQGWSASSIDSCVTVWTSCR